MNLTKQISDSEYRINRWTSESTNPKYKTEHPRLKKQIQEEKVKLDRFRQELALSTQHSSSKLGVSKKVELISFSNDSTINNNTNIRTNEEAIDNKNLSQTKNQSELSKPILNKLTYYKINSFGIENIQNIEFSQATCINNNGEVTGGLFIGGMHIHDSTFLWTKEMGLSEIFLNKAFSPSDINDNTQIVGSIPEEKGFSSGYVWSLKDGFVNTKQFNANAINDSGVMAGIYNCGQSRTFIKTSTDTKSLNLQLHVPLEKIYDFVSYTEHPRAINNKNEIIGSLNFCGLNPKGSKRKQGLHSHGFLWNPNGNCIDFGDHKIPTDINDLSQVILVSDFSEKGTSWFWEKGNFTILWDDGIARAINIKQEIVGSQHGNAVIYENGNIKNLIDLVVNVDGWSKLNMAMDINNSGEIVGTGIFKGKETAFLLTPNNS